MANDKAPGKSGLTTDMLKHLQPKALQLYVDLIQEYWRNPDINYDTWNIIHLAILIKGKVIHRTQITTETSAWKRCHTKY
jgi:hypothetical protein